MGGTFDPVHYGHLRCAEEARRKLHLETVYLLPAANPVHRPAPVASPSQRLAMLKLALTEFPNLAIDTREIKRGGPSYMVDTLLELLSVFKGRPLILLLGQDAANQLHRWDRWRQLFELAHIVVLGRPGSKAHYRNDVALEIKHRSGQGIDLMTSSVAGRVLTITVGAHAISATSIKGMLRRGLQPNQAMSAAELEYIQKQGLYS